MAHPAVWIWNKAPFIRFLIPLIAGILIQWNCDLSWKPALFFLVGSIICLLGVFFLPLFFKFRHFLLHGFAVNIIFLSTGIILTWQKDIRNKSNWIGNAWNNKDLLVMTLAEPLNEKPKSFKALANVDGYGSKNSFFQTTGKIIVYIKKDSGKLRAGYGSVIITKKQPELIRITGNPGGFDYKQFCLFRDITHQIFLSNGDYIFHQNKYESWFRKCLFLSRERILKILRSYIYGDKERGLAEALLIGYRDHLDKTLVQSYSNTGVVHIIAISGLHLGLIYGLLVRILHPLYKRKKFKLVSACIIIISLWLFSLLAGAQPSVLRSAVMFTCIITGKSIKRNASIFNSLAVSAFMLLCYNPFWLWDIGFQLSYVAVLSIAIFFKPVYDYIYFKTSLFDFIWKLSAVTISAQILTLPLVLYHFHQFPNFFLLTNLVAVPLSGIILIGEILLCSVSFIPWLASLIGNILQWLIFLMNSFIETINGLPYAVWTEIQINIFQTVLIFIAIAAFSYWLMKMLKIAFIAGISSLLFFIFFRSWELMEAQKQHMLIIYNVPQHQAIDIIEGRKYLFIGDSGLSNPGYQSNFYIKPARLLFRIYPGDVKNFYLSKPFFQFHNKKVLVIDTSVKFNASSFKFKIDLVIISKNAEFDLKDLLNIFIMHQVVFDSSLPGWKIRKWKRQCNSLRVSYHDVNEMGAFIMRP